MFHVEDHPLLTALDDIRPRLRTMLGGIDTERCLSDAIVNEMRESGVFRMAVPAEYGGWEADPLVQLRAVEMLAEVDASIGWYAMIGSDGGFYGAFLQPEVAKRLHSPDPNVITAGFVDPAGVARPVEDGYVITGRWPFGSASRHSQWLASGCRVRHDDGRASPPIVAMLASEECEIHDTWNAMGLRGSGSFDYSVGEYFVPKEMTFSFQNPPVRTDPLYRFPMMYRANVPGVALGLARAAIREFTEWVSGRRDAATGRDRRENAGVQHAAGLAEAQVSAARAYAVDVIGELWETLLRGDEPAPDMPDRFRLMIAHTGISCRQAVQSLFTACGGSAVYDRHPLQRRMRDAMTVTQHALHDEQTYSTMGGRLLGLPAGGGVS
ncbi:MULTISPECIES: acyl-CoA dehydrogenase family protein [unclassified Streptomyces]|uniref:acyl-CoA dehydrogenase family protein n=1 Tax=unclassified Streptomyces TaxID=2593676 RepID=UPI000378008A|nr:MULTISPECIES: acyl-CoA dehydrogenase family protein [unclassified Streptomyces]MYY05931.1 acyl-CoA dehydrogenase [Streptomyces sp. SID4913]